MKAAFLVFFIGIFANHAVGEDRFNYDATDEDARDFGPADWGMVQCNIIDTCVSLEDW